MLKNLSLAFVALLLSTTVFAQKQTKPYQEWNQKEIDKILDNSPWAQTQVETDTSEMFFKPDPMTGSSADRTANGQTNQATSVNYRVRFLSAKPIRQAFARKIAAQQKSPNPQLLEQLNSFIDRDFSDYIVVAVDFDTKDPRFRNTPAQAFAAAVPATLKSRTYLDRNDGKRLFLLDYKPPSNDGMGAKFIFARNVDGQPFLTQDFSQVRFYAEVSSGSDSVAQSPNRRDSKQIKIDVRFKISEMQYNGRLEY